MNSREAYLEQLYTYGTGGEAGAQVVSVVYFALIPADLRCETASGLRWFRVEELPPLAGNHVEIVAYALRRLRYKLEYSASGLRNCCRKQFTLRRIAAHLRSDSGRTPG